MNRICMILQTWLIPPNPQIKRKKARIAKDTQRDKAVFTWIVKDRQAGIPISNSGLSIQAQKLYSDLQVDNPGDSVASKGLLNCYQCQLRISQVKSYGEANSVPI